MPGSSHRLGKYYLRKNLSLAWPLALNALLIQSMLIIDILLVSPLGEVSLASMGIATTIIAFFLGLHIALGNGSQLIIGRLFGANSENKIPYALRLALSHSVCINMIAAILFVLIITLFGDELVALLTTDITLARYVNEYLSVVKYILFFNAITQAFTVFLNGQGDTKTAFSVYLIEVPFNAIASYLLIHGIESMSVAGLGFIGAAYGSLIAVVLRLILLSLHITKLEIITAVPKRELWQYQGIFKHFEEVLPVATNFLVLSVGNTIYQLLFSKLDIYSYVAVTLIFPWLRIATQFIVAWAQANAISITQAIGKNKQENVIVIVKSCLKVGAVMACIVALALYILALNIDHIYPKIQSQTLLALASIMPLYVALPLFRTYNTIAGNSLRAMGESVKVLNIHFITQWIIVLPLCGIFILYYQWPLFWAFALLPIEEALKAIPFYLMLKKKAAC